MAASHTTEWGGDRAVADNRKARPDYHILETWEAGVVLLRRDARNLCGCSDARASA